MATTTERVDALTETLIGANGWVALQRLREVAYAVGAQAPEDITDDAFLSGLEARARASATSIVATQDARADALAAQYGDDTAGAQAAYDAWFTQQAQMIASYEAGMASRAALAAFVTNNELAGFGEEWVDPPQAGCADCQELVDAGRQPIGTFEDDAVPVHPNCTHALTQAFEIDADSVDDLWLGND